MSASPFPGPDPAPASDSVESLVMRLGDEYLKQLQEGKTPNREAILRAHPAIAPLLEQQFRVVEIMHGMAGGRPGPAAVSPGRLGRYTLHAVLGQGATAVVYRAYDPKLDREVALKVLRQDRPGTGDTDERFRRDAVIAAQLRHPHIVALHEVGEHDGVRYIDMELVRGETLAERLGRGPVPAEAAADLVRKVALALDYAHQHDIVHRDVKSSNILLDDGGEPRLTDFGLARRSLGEAPLTCHGQILGTPGYMPPEQALGNARQADRRSDVYGLGVVLYELLTNRLPFPAGESLTAQLYHILHTDPPAPRSLNRTIPRDLETICLKALAKEPAERFASAADFAAELGRWLRGEPLHIRPRSLRERAWHWARRHRLAAATLGVASVVLAVVAGVLGSLAWAGFRRAYEMQVRAELLNATLRERDTLLADVWVRDLLQQARERVRKATVGRRLQTQDLLRKIAEPRKLLAPGEPRDGHDLEARSLWVETLGVPDLRITATADLPFRGISSWAAALHPDGQTIAIAGRARPVPWRRGPAPKLVGSPDAGGPVPHLGFSPDGRYLAFAPGRGGLQVWDGAVSRCLLELEPPEATAAVALGFDADGGTVWACHADGRVPSWGLPAGNPKPSRDVLAHPEGVRVACFNADASLLAVADAAHRVLVCRRGEVLSRLPAAATEVFALAWSADSRLLAVSTKDGQMQVWKRDGDRLVQHPAPVLGWYGVRNLLFSPDGHWLLGGLDQGALGVWEVASGAQVLAGNGVPWGMTADGRHLALAENNRASFAEFLPPEGLLPLAGHRVGIGLISWSRDNAHLVSLDNRFEVRTWDATRAEEVDAFQAPPGGFYAHNAAVAISDDARYVAYASGAEEGPARVLVRDVRAHTTAGPWPLPPGFEFMTYAGGRFLLVREERTATDAGADGEAWPTQSVVYEVWPDRPPGPPRVLRRAEPSDVRRFYSPALSRDGRYYVWAGPRVPTSQWRVEVYEVATERLVLRLRRGTPASTGELGAWLAPRGDTLWVGDGRNEGGVYDLSGRLLRQLPADAVIPIAVSPVARLVVSGHGGSLLLSQDPGQIPWLELANADQSPFAVPQFSEHGRYLAWGSLSGTLTLADLQVLQEQVVAFERAIRGE